MTAAIRGDACRLPLADETVDLIVTSPPYYLLRSYVSGGEALEGQIGCEESPAAFIDSLLAVTAECARVLKPSGSMFVNLGDKYSGSGGPGGDYNPGGLRDGQPRIGAQQYWSRSSPRTSGIRAKSLMLLPERYRIGCVDRLGLIARAVVVWSKPNGLPESVTDRVRRSHEDWVHLTREGRYFSAVDEIREPYAPGTAERYESGFGIRSREEHETTKGYTNADGGPSSTNPLGKLPGSVWSIPSEPLVVPDWLGVDHFAAFPQELPRRLILGWSPSGICVACGEGRRPITERTVGEPDSEAEVARLAQFQRERVAIGGGSATNLGRRDVRYEVSGYFCACPQPSYPTRPAVVLDPFGGTGTTAMVARALGRVGISVDLSADYCRLARWRIFESGHGAKARERTNRANQGAML